MFDELTTCKPEELQEHAERIAKMLNADNAEALSAFFGAVFRS